MSAVRDETPQCGAMNEMTGNGPCWRAPGHDGAHIANYGGDLLVTWPSEATEDRRWG